LAGLLKVAPENAYTAVANRVGQDVRYSLDDTKIRALGWSPRKSFDEELKKIVLQDDFKRFL
jgi:dTDP-glucose 4,6-dehydratase